MEPIRRLRNEWKIFAASAVVTPLTIGYGLSLDGFVSVSIIIWGVLVGLVGGSALLGGIDLLDKHEGFFNENPSYRELSAEVGELRLKVQELEATNAQLTDGLIAEDRRIDEVTIPAGGTVRFTGTFHGKQKS